MKILQKLFPPKVKEVIDPALLLPDDSYFLVTHLRHNKILAVRKTDEERFFNARPDELFVCFRFKGSGLNLNTPIYYSRAELEHNALLEKSSEPPHLFT